MDRTAAGVHAQHRRFRPDKMEDTLMMFRRLKVFIGGAAIAGSLALALAAPAEASTPASPADAGTASAEVTTAIWHGPYPSLGICEQVRLFVFYPTDDCFYIPWSGYYFIEYRP
jgi:hypothetical protein